MELTGLNNLSSYTNTMRSSIAQNKETQFDALLSKAMDQKDEKELKQACVQFESYFIQTMFKEMRKTIQYGEGFIKHSQAETMFQDLLDEESSKSLANAGGIGLSTMLLKNLKQNATTQTPTS